MAFDLASAAAATGVAKSSVLRAIKGGRISAQRDDAGRRSAEPVAAASSQPPALHLAMDARDGMNVMMPMQGVVDFLVALAIMLFAAIGAMLLHYNGIVRPDSFGFGVGIFAIVGAFMLYRVFFWRE